ncbi:MAG: MBL fold metallo-hydrolase [Candidatus Buchananbacteria bacterium]|nr:MBL fold metallo-hydrolase [Candidatus Buchananbacteria bacterium]
MQIKTLGDKPLSLRNDGQLEVFFIGVGAAFATTLHQTNFLIIKGDTHIMVDFGMTGPAALLQTAQHLPEDVEVVLPTHSHADHVGGIECLGLKNRYLGIPFLKKPIIKMIIGEEYQRILWDYTLRGGMEYNEEEGGKNLVFGDYFDVTRPVWKTFQPREIFELDFKGIHLEIFRTNHYPAQSHDWQTAFVSFGLFIDDNVFISGDTQFDPELIDLYGDRSEVMFHDVQFFPGAVHAPLNDLKTLPDKIKAKMYLMHYADTWPEQDITGFAGWAEQGVRYIF